MNTFVRAHFLIIQFSSILHCTHTYRAGYGIADLTDPLRDKSEESDAGDM